jgi:hypothetical protein
MEPDWRMIVHRPEVPFLSRHRRQLIARVLALTLLLAQFGAQAHAYSHLASDLRGAPHALQSCATCLSFAPVTMAVGSAPCVMPVAHCAAEPALPVAAVSIPDASPFPAYQPRAPPQFL